MTTNRRPIRRVLLLGSTLFVLLLCATMALQSYLMFSSWYYKEYGDELRHIISAVEGTIDVDDLQECVRTRVESPKFHELQQLVNTYVDDFGLTYLYVSIPREEGVMISVCSSTNAEERAAGEDDWPIMYEITEEYDEESIKPYLNAWDASGIYYFESSSGWGTYYTACKPLVASDGEKVALLCADLETRGMHREINSYVLRSIALIAAVGVGFGVLLITWLRRNVTEPVQALEHSARSFAERSHGLKDPELLLFQMPDIHTQNELESLARAITQMSEDMRDYVGDILLAESRAKSAEEQAEGMSRVAYEDPLTHVKSKAAYEVQRDRLESRIADGQAEFAIVMVDLNCLKYVNDTYGHKRGDDYIVGACKLICRTFAASTVCRIGGDEFVVLVEGEDYGRRTELLAVLEERFRQCEADEGREPWERYSAAVGMAEYSPRDASYVKVFNRADNNMYRNKAQAKRQRHA